MITMVQPRAAILLLGTILVVGVIAGAPRRQAASATPAAEPRGAAVPKLLSWMGSYSAIGKKETLRNTDAKMWEELWKRHKGDAIERDSYGEPVIPIVDF